MDRLTRRSFIRWVITSGAAMACPIPLPAAEAEKAAPETRMRREDFEVCHKVRDRVPLPLAAPSRSVDVVVVGAGPSGLGAADGLAGSDFMVLEKEPQVGGNAYSENWNGLEYCTGSAWISMFSPEVKALMTRWKIDPPRIQGFDAVYAEGRWVRDFWDGRSDSARIDELPYDDGVKKGIREFLKELEAMDLDKDMAALDARPFSELLAGKPEPLRRYWDNFGLSNWGAEAKHSSAYIGAQAARDWPKEPRYTYEGGLGGISKRVFEGFPEDTKKRFVLGAAVYRVKRAGKRVLVGFMKDGRPECVSAKSVVFSGPKMMASRVIDGLPKKQVAAMQAIRYAPYPVYNLCFTRRVADVGYDSWVIGAKNFTDIVQADWVTRGRTAAPGDPQVLTLYAPMRENERADLLDDEESLLRAERAAAELGEVFPGALDHLAEVRVFRRGHAMPMSAPNWTTKVQPAARKDFGPVYFAHSDAAGEVSDVAYGALAGVEAAAKALKHI
ncbi:MAG: FAD-dependent oxidoreductase [Elusimicrobia bacterium]|nr:FAD-dependent oxidoreductase [Elusimicrobiota bacterium]